MNRILYRTLAVLVAVSFTFLAADCGTILYPERLRQEPSGKVHAPTLIMDCLWLFVFIIPGVVAIAVDLANRTMYYSEAELSSIDRNEDTMVVLIL